MLVVRINVAFVSDNLEDIFNKKFELKEKNKSD